MRTSRDPDATVANETTTSPPIMRTASAAPPTLSLRDITKHFDAVAALTDVTFDVLPGEVHALLGENGAGKSTLMNVASGATDPDDGTIVFEGEREVLIKRRSHWGNR